MWKFDVSGMTPAQLEVLINALKSRIYEQDRYALMSGANVRDEATFLREVISRLERGLPENRPMPANTVL